MAQEDRLQTLAVTVEEPQPGVFAWALLERQGTAWSTVDEARARSVRASYREAMADGLLALQQRVDDLERGPRVPARNRKAAPRESGADEATGAKAAEPSGYGKRLFGFGPRV